MITLPVKILDIRSTEPMAMITTHTAKILKLKHTDTITLKADSTEKSIVASPVVVQGILEDDIIGIGANDASWLGVKDGSMLTVLARRPPQSYEFIKRKILGQKWSQNQIQTIVGDISKRKYTSMEVSAFALASQFQGYDSDELVYVAQSMAEAGTQLAFNEPTFDKHSIGGIPGNKITPIIVSIVAAAGLLIPKTSSRAITSPSGTADTMEVLADVTFTPEEIMEIAPVSRGMIVWNAPLNLSPLDDIVIGVKRQLGLDPRDQMLASIVSTKIAMNVNNLIFDIPTGIGSKMPNRNDALDFAYSMIGLCRRVGIAVEAAITFGEQPLGVNIGPALEAQEALQVLEGKGPDSVREKSVSLAGILLEMAHHAGPGKGIQVAEQYLDSGKALTKLKDIIEHQGGDPKITSDKVPIGDAIYEIQAPKDGYVTFIDNKLISQICQAAGAPKDKQAGLALHTRQGEFIHEGDPMMTIYSSSENKLSLAIQTANAKPAVQIEGMIIRRIGTIPEEEA